MNFEILHTVLITIHALAGVVCFVFGSISIFSNRQFDNRRLFSLYLWSLVAMVVFLAGAMAVWWTVYTGIEQVAFVGLFVLAVYMLYRAFNARTLLQTRQNNWSDEYIHHIGFTLISLFEGFVIVSLLNLQIAGWMVALVAILGVIAGRRLIDMAENRLDISA